MKVAIISDIHGNFEALKSVLKDIKQKSVDKIICAGDIIGKGINSRKCIDLIKKNCDIVLRGNVDDRYCQSAQLYKDNEVEYNRIKFYQTLMNDEDQEFLSNLDICYEFYLSGNLVRVFHAHPTSPYKTINNYNTDFNEKYNLFKPSKFTKSDKIADFVIYGHVHYQFMEKIYNRTIINTGSVGCPGCLIFDENINCEAREIRQAHYIILEGKENCKTTKNITVSFESVNYDIDKEFANNDNNPEKEFYYDELYNAKYRYIQNAMNTLKEEGYKF